MKVLALAENVMVELTLEGNQKIVVFDRLMAENTLGKIECARNIFKLDKLGNTVWQVASEYDRFGDPFTNIWIDATGELLAYRWDGGSYSINPATGFATPKELLR